MPDEDINTPPSGPPPQQPADPIPPGLPPDTEPQQN